MPCLALVLTPELCTAGPLSIVNGSNEIVIIVICIIDLNLLLKAEYWAIPTVETSQESFTTYVNFS